MSIVYFLRHGQTANNKRGGNGSFDNNEPLNQYGELQSQHAARVFLSKGPLQQPRLVVSSPLLRTLQTATILCENLHIPLFSNPDLSEFNPGHSSGQTINEVLGLYAAVKKSELPNFKLDGGESWHDIAQRTNRTVSHYLITKPSPIVIVSHASVIQICVNSLIGLKPDQWLSINEPKNGEILELRFSDNRWYLKRDS